MLFFLASLASLDESNAYAFVAAGCSSTHKDGVSFFKLPRDPVEETVDESSPAYSSSMEI